MLFTFTFDFRFKHDHSAHFDRIIVNTVTMDTNVFSGQGGAKLRVFLKEIAQKGTQLCPSLTLKPSTEGIMVNTMGRICKVHR